MVGQQTYAGAAGDYGDLAAARVQYGAGTGPGASEGAYSLAVDAGYDNHIADLCSAARDSASGGYDTVSTAQIARAETRLVPAVSTPAGYDTVSTTQIAHAEARAAPTVRTPASYDTVSTAQIAHAEARQPGGRPAQPRGGQAAGRQAGRGNIQRANRPGSIVSLRGFDEDAANADA